MTITLVDPRRSYGQMGDLSGPAPAVGWTARRSLLVLLVASVSAWAAIAYGVALAIRAGS